MPVLDELLVGWLAGWQLGEIAGNIFMPFPIASMWVGSGDTLIAFF